MNDQELKEATIQYIKKYCERHKEAPSLRKILKHFKRQKLNFMRFYKIFPQGLAEACRLAGVPAPKERIKRMERVAKASKTKGKEPEGLDEVKDEGLKEALSKALEWEKKRDKAKALVEAERREREAKRGALEKEAMLNPKEIPAYLEWEKSPLLGDLRRACALEKLSLEDGCVRAVADYGKTYLERCEARPANEKGNPDFGEYVNEALTLWTENVKFWDANERWSKTTYSGRCDVCGAKYEYEKNEGGVLNMFKCPNNCEGTGMIIHYPCPVCKDAYGLKERLTYDPKTNVLQCSFCGSQFKVESPAMRPKGSAYKGEDPPTNQEIKAYVTFMEECTAKQIDPRKMLTYISRHSEKLIKEYMADEIREYYSLHKRRLT